MGGLIYSPLTRPVNNITDSYTQNLKGSGNLLWNREKKIKFLRKKLPQTEFEFDGKIPKNQIFTK